MPVKASYILVQSNGLSDNQVKLGRLVTNIWTPFISYHDPPNISDTHGRLHQTDEITNHNSTLYFNNNRNDSLSLKLSKLFGIGIDRSSNSALVIKAKSVSTSTLSDCVLAFDCIFDGPADNTATGTSTTRSWIQNRIQGGHDVYMVVGIQTVTDAHITQLHSFTTNPSSSVAVPVSEIASHGAAAVASTVGAGGWSALDVSLAIAMARTA
jgi:hypothetical protein